MSYLINPYSFGGGSLLLDVYPSTGAAFSVRKIRTAYAGAAVRVRRSSDNAEQDIGFSGNDLDTSSLATFVGANDGFVTTWYDQSGQGNNATQTTAGVQPRIVSAGTIETQNAKTTIRCLGTRHLFVPRFAYTMNSVSVVAVATQDSTGMNGMLYNAGEPGPADSRLYLCWSHAPSGEFRMTLGDASNFVFSDVTGRRIFELHGGTGASGRTSLRNGSTGTPATRAEATATCSTHRFSIGSFLPPSEVASLFWNGNIQELVHWKTDKTADRVGINSNMNTYYTVY